MKSWLARDFSPRKCSKQAEGAGDGVAGALEFVQCGGRARLQCAAALRAFAEMVAGSEDIGNRVSGALPAAYVAAVGAWAWSDGHGVFLFRPCGAGAAGVGRVIQ